MEDPLVISLVVTGIGMLMLFLALAVLYGLMYLMTALIKDRPEMGEREQGAGGERQGAGRIKQDTRSGEPEAGGERRRAAVIGVALARAELELSQAVAPEVEAGPSAWQQYHRQRVLDLNLR
jgi:Na+-transporting methylmalonyl-CoA/oxaloacetate decarboxylase gamma subunit